MDSPFLPPVQPYHPTTFLERGVAVPFTTPLLGGTRARPAEKGGLELVVPNPSGGRGVYVMGWNGIIALCRPTLHDKQLCERIAVVKHVTPATIRRVAREVAAEGLAGEAAMEAAQTAMKGEHDDRLLANYQLLVRLVEQIGLKLPAEGGQEPNMETRARATVAHIAPGLGRTPPWVAAALEAIAGCLTLVGIKAASKDARIPRLMVLLADTRDQVSEWSQTQVEDDQASYARMVCNVAELTLALARTTLTRVHALTDDVRDLLRSWSIDPLTITQIAARPEWLLDGWEKICLIWQLASDDAGRRAALAEMAELIPVLPKEAKEWCEISQDVDVAVRLRRLVRLNEDWRTGGTVYSLIARNEHIRAITC